MVQKVNFLVSLQIFLFHFMSIYLLNSFQNFTLSMPAGDEPPGWILKSWNCSFKLTTVTTTFGKEDSDCLIPVSI